MRRGDPNIYEPGYPFYCPTCHTQTLIDVTAEWARTHPEDWKRLRGERWEEHNGSGTEESG